MPSSVWAPRAARQGRGQALARAGWSTCCCASGPQGDLLRPPPRRPQPGEAAPRTRTGSCSPSTSRRTCCDKQIRHRTTGGCASTRPRSSRTPRGWRARNGHDPDFPLRLIGLRELRSHNSWMHNSPLLMRGGRTHAARIHPDDAEAARRRRRRARAGSARAHGAIEIEALLTDEVKRGTIAVPHGWGHSGGWKVANRGRRAPTSTCSPPPTPPTSSGWPGWRT